MNAESLPVSLDQIIACHECDALHPIRPLGKRGSALCARCGAFLYGRKDDTINRALAFSIAGAVLYAVANLFPFMYFKAGGVVEVNTIISGVFAIGRYDMWPLAAVVFLSSVLAPGLKILFLLYLLVPLSIGRRAPGAERVYRWLTRVGPWGMLEVYMLGVLVAIVNLTAMASISMGYAFYAFIALFLATTAASAAMDPVQIWAKLEVRQ